MLETGINNIEWPSLQYCTISAFGGDAWQRKAMSHKSSFMIIDKKESKYRLTISTALVFSSTKSRVLSLDLDLE